MEVLYGILENNKSHFKSDPDLHGDIVKWEDEAVIFLILRRL